MRDGPGPNSYKQNDGDILDAFVSILRLSDLSVCTLCALAHRMCVNLGDRGAECCTKKIHVGSTWETTPLATWMGKRQVQVWAFQIP
jgi:hypothetical protein